jgi:hypothetical protein
MARASRALGTVEPITAMIFLSAMKLSFGLRPVTTRPREGARVVHDRGCGLEITIDRAPVVLVHLLELLPRHGRGRKK